MLNLQTCGGVAKSKKKDRSSDIWIDYLMGGPDMQQHPSSLAALAEILSKIGRKLYILLVGFNFPNWRKF